MEREQDNFLILRELCLHPPTFLWSLRCCILDKFVMMTCLDVFVFNCLFFTMKVASKAIKKNTSQAKSSGQTGGKSGWVLCQNFHVCFLVSYLCLVNYCLMSVTPLCNIHKKLICSSPKDNCFMKTRNSS